jgi:hypothetical protein
MIMANLPTHMHHSRAMPRLTGGILMLGERGVMVVMGHGLCVCFCVCERPQKIKLDLNKVNTLWSIDRMRLTIIKLADNMVRSISDILLVWHEQLNLPFGGEPPKAWHPLLWTVN